MDDRKKMISEEPTKSDNLLQRIENRKDMTDKAESEIAVKMERFMVIQIDKKKYAIHAEEVREIMGDVPIFYVPFVPPYVRGFINRHGEPYSVLDIKVIFEQESLDSSTFLILNRENDQLAILISDVVEIVRISDHDYHKITSEEEDDFFKGAVSLRKEEIFVLDMDQILKKLENDVNAV